MFVMFAGSLGSISSQVCSRFVLAPLRVCLCMCACVRARSDTSLPLNSLSLTLSFSLSLSVLGALRVIVCVVRAFFASVRANCVVRCV